MTIDSLQKNCYGCECCENICSKKAIKMIQNFEGFYYPKIDFSKCIDCGICYNKCPQNQLVTIKNQKYYGFSKYKEVLSCASGGVATYLSKKIIGIGGFVCGCIYDDDFKVKHILSNNIDDINKMSGSKYVQSSLNEVYDKIKIRLNEGKYVLFIGTPCQVAGIKSYLNDRYDNFYSIDLVCHGVPSPKLFDYYIKWLQDINKSKLTSYNFRFKKDGKMGHNIKYSFANGKTKVVDRELDKYDLDYKKRIIYRESCYDCQYSYVEKRTGDISIGDFWGLDKNNLNYDERGVSSILVNSKKGEWLISLIDDNLLFESNINEIRNKQDALNGSTIRTNDRDNYYKNIDNSFFYRKKQPRLSMKKAIKRLIKKFFKL